MTNSRVFQALGPTSRAVQHNKLHIFAFDHNALTLLAHCLPNCYAHERDETFAGTEITLIIIVL